MEKMIKLFTESINLKKSVIENGSLEVLENIGDVISESISKGGKLMLCGNGGSASDAQHLAAELLVRLRPAVNRQALPAIALAMDTSTITACGNDYSFNSLYERMVEALGNPGDILLGISTSGKSKNVIQAFHAAKKKGIICCAFLGAGGGEMLGLSDYAFVVPGYITGRIQEVHITAGHALMEFVEDKLIETGYLAKS